MWQFDARGDQPNDVLRMVQRVARDERELDIGRFGVWGEALG